MNQKNEKGITLIALVITIIVLLILAGVTISMVLDDDGIIAQAQGAQKAQTEGELKEKIELWNGNVRMAELGGEEITKEEYNKFTEEVKALADKLEIAKEDVKVSEGKITIDGKEVEILFPNNYIKFEVGGCEVIAPKGTTWEEFIGNELTITTDYVDENGENLHYTLYPEPASLIEDCIYVEHWFGDIAGAWGSYLCDASSGEHIAVQYDDEIKNNVSYCLEV